MNGELNKKNLGLAITVVLTMIFVTSKSSNLFLLSALTLSYFYMFKLNTDKFDKFIWGGLSALSMITFLTFFIKSILIMVSKYI